MRHGHLRSHDVHTVRLSAQTRLSQNAHLAAINGLLTETRSRACLNESCRNVPLHGRVRVRYHNCCCPLRRHCAKTASNVPLIFVMGLFVMTAAAAATRCAAA